MTQFDALKFDCRLDFSIWDMLLIQRLYGIGLNHILKMMRYFLMPCTICSLYSSIRFFLGSLWGGAGVAFWMPHFMIIFVIALQISSTFLLCLHKSWDPKKSESKSMRITVAFLILASDKRLLAKGKNTLMIWS